MADTYWLKQTKDKPLFPDLLWSRPENKRYAGKLLIVGGNLHGFAAPGSAYGAALKAGIGTCRVLLPDSLEKIIKLKGAPQPTRLDAVPGSNEQRASRTQTYGERAAQAADTAMRQEPAGTAGSAGRQGKAAGELWAEFAPSTRSGSFSKTALAQLLDNAQWADGVLLAGDFGRNSETAILLDSFMNSFEGQVTVAQDGLDYFWGPKTPLIERPNTLSVINLGKLQKLAKNNRPATPILHNVMLADLVETLHDWTTGNLGQIITKHANNFIVATGGQVSTTPAPAPTLVGDKVRGSDLALASVGKESNWQIELAAYASVWWLQNPEKPFDAITTAIYDFALN